MARHRIAVISQPQRQVITRPEPANAFNVFTGLAGRLALQIVKGRPGVTVQATQRRLLALHQHQQLTQQGMFEHIGVVAGVIAVTVIHGVTPRGGSA